MILQAKKKSKKIINIKKSQIKQKLYKKNREIKIDVEDHRGGGYDDYDDAHSEEVDCDDDDDDDEDDVGMNLLSE